MTVDYEDRNGVVWRVKAALFRDDQWEVHWYKRDNPTKQATTRDYSLPAAIERIRGVVR